MRVVHNPLEVMERNFRRPSGLAGRFIGHVMALQHRSLTVWTIEQMNIAAGDRILDIGCGSGMAIQLMAAEADQGTLAGIDYSPEMVTQASRRNAPAVNAGRVEIRPGDAMNLPYPDASFDHVTAIETFYFWPDPKRGLAEAHRVLKPGGQVVVTLEMSREVSADPSMIQRLFGNRFTARSERDGLHIVSGADLTKSLTDAGFIDAGFTAEPARSLGWVCARGRRP
jgi:SAM-dependent methyltransferase